MGRKIFITEELRIVIRVRHVLVKIEVAVVVCPFSPHGKFVEQSVHIDFGTVVINKTEPSPRVFLGENILSDQYDFN